MTTNRDRAAEIIYSVEKDSEIGIVDVPAMIDLLADAGVPPPDDHFRAARGTLTEWWLNLDKSGDSRASTVGAVIDMMDDQMKDAHAQKEETNE